jgi:hypothetical protein
MESLPKRLICLMKKYRIILLIFLCSVLIQIVLNFKNENFIGTIAIQFFASAILSYVFMQYYKKYNEEQSYTRIWSSIYGLIVCLNLALILLEVIA